MTHSANEVQSLAAKAARGAGFPAGQSEAFGRATVLHLAAGRDPAALVSALANPTNSPILRLALLSDDLLAACAAMDGTAEITLNPADIDLALSYAELVPVRLIRHELVHCDDQIRLSVTADLETPWRAPLPTRIDLPADLNATLSALAAKTYVPATEASRRRGAGAGLTDND